MAYSTFRIPLFGYTNSTMGWEAWLRSALTEAGVVLEPMKNSFNVMEAPRIAPPYRMYRAQDDAIIIEQDCEMAKTWVPDNEEDHEPGQQKR